METRLEHTLYHRFLRVSMVVFAVVLVFQSGLISETTAQMSRGTSAYLANAVGMSAGVEPTPLNQYTAALTQKEQELKIREAALAEREIMVTLDGGAVASDATTTYILAGILFILLVLILLNYVLDYLRFRETQRTQPV